MLKIEEAAKELGITRLCHFTPSRKLAHILVGELGILATRNLTAAERDLFNATDLSRLDGKPECICCSIEYPNGWYFKKARERDPLFKDWVVLFIKPDYLWRDGVFFCPLNAAKAYGGHLRQGYEGFSRLYEGRVAGRSRSPGQLSCCPTDDQAEVLIPDRISVSDILGVAVASEQQALLEFARLKQCGYDASRIRFVVAPMLFESHALSGSIRAGRRPDEHEWTPGDGK
ncbi:DarT ssDNA thymidine ADP-ribosyltransferase family protein [Azospirillum sp. Marseille-Q6669]